ncbi:M14 family murein peptide amidase A [Oxalobacteraceae bacterium R-40]|uniref:M14 family murein peptide amidase A n=1 Tax=Keguizhuia sedimenti TaxID=3064264 RepID=A0ABU1BLX7_9BURK|nr:M14 family murein peptide amidase A [Oxalobacteraceae bacterium R-40]
MMKFSVDSSPYAVRLAGIFVLLAFPLLAQASVTNLQTDWCKRLVPRLPEVSQAACESAQLSPSGSYSLQKFPILARHIPAQKKDGMTQAVRVLMLGGIHGDELTAASIVFKWMEFLHRPLARSFEWKIAPVVNPDGLLAASPKRVNANGVDLNRNFPTPNWEHEAPHYWASKTRSDPRRFPGKLPLSEPESRWLHEEIERFRPHVIISVHAPYGVLDFDGPAHPPRRFGHLHLNQVGVYPGSLGNYSGLHKNIPVITIELPNARAMPSRQEVQRIWQDMLTWIQTSVPSPSGQNGTLQTIRHSSSGK